MNMFQKKLLQSCMSKGMSVQDMYEQLQMQRDLCKKMMDHEEECFARKVYKKSCMTVANYGATQRTSRADVIYQLKNMNSTFLEDLESAELNMFCNMVFWSLEEAAPSSMEFLNYFRKLLRFVLKHKDYVYFNNPLTGFPVALRVREQETKDYVYKIMGKNVKTVLVTELQTTHSQKTTTSSVPGIIHSIDAAILVMLKDGLMEEDMSFIHDSCGLHPNNIEKAKESVYTALNTVMNGNVLQSIVDQLLEGIEDVPDALKTAPYQGTWTGDINEETSYYAYS